MKEFILPFNDIQNHSLFNSETLSDDQLEILNQIRMKFERSTNILGDIELLHNDDAQDNSLILEILKEANLTYEQIISTLTNKEIAPTLFNKLSIDDFIKYVLNEIPDMTLVNEYLKNHKTAFKKLINIMGLIPNNSLNIDYSKDLAKYITPIVLKKCSNSFVTQYLVDNFKNFNKFIEFIEDNKHLLNKINSNSLIFSAKYSKDVTAYLKKHPQMANLFNIKYYKDLDLNALYKKGIVNAYILSQINSSDNNVYTVENIKKCSDGSIDYPIIDLRDIDVLADYAILRKFNDYRIVEYINNLSEDERVNLLRDVDFTNFINNYTIELIVNSLSFKSLFNMTQNREIFDKISNINTKISDRDVAFIKGFLDSVVLVKKCNHSMLYRMLMQIDNIEVYLLLPYIYTKLTASDIIDLVINKCENFSIILDNDNLFNRLSSDTLANYINTKKNKDFLDLISNKKILKKLFNLSDDLLNSINIDEVNYLFETIRTKDILSIQDKNYTVLTYRAVLASYLAFGIKDTLKIITEGNKDITVSMVKDEIQNILYHNLLDYRKNNSAILQNIDKKIVYYLKDAPTDTKDNFIKFIINQGYINSVVSLIVNNGYSSITEIMDLLFNYKLYENDFEARKELNNFCNGFSVFILNKKKVQIGAKLESIAKNEFELKSSVRNKDYNHTKDEYVKLFKLRIFVDTLTSDDKLDYFYAYRDDYDVFNIKDKYKNYLGTSEIDIDSIIKHILTPLSLNKFDKFKCLEELGFRKPKDYDLYMRNISDINVVNEINKFISSLDYEQETIVEILNSICYGTNVSNKVSVKHKNKIKELNYKTYEILGEIYIDKTALKVIYTNTIDIDNEEEILVYLNYLDIIDEIIEKTFNYINRHMVKEKIQRRNMKLFLDTIKVDDKNYAFNSKNFDIKKRIFSLKDIEKIFAGFSFDKSLNINDDLKNLLFNKNLVKFISMGLYQGQIDNLGYIISIWDNILKVCDKLHLDISTLDIFDINKLIMGMHYEYSNRIPLNILFNIYSDTYSYDSIDVLARLEDTSKLIDASILKTSSSVPMIGVSNEDYSLSVLDYQDSSNYLLGFDTDYRIGSSGGALLAYSVLSQNGFVLVVKDKDDNIVGRINGTRNGNALFLTKPVLIADVKLDKLLIEFSKNIVNYTKDANEPIEIVSINNYDYGINIDESSCSYINKPVKFSDVEINKFKNLGIEIDDSLNDKYSGTVNVIYSTKPLDRNAFVSYNPTTLYDRIRDNINIYNGLIDESVIDRINCILYRYYSINDKDYYNNIDYESFKTIYLATDYVVFVTNDDEILSFILPFDSRAMEEVDMIVNNINNTYKKTSL